MYFVIRHCRLLEESYLNRIADFVYLWLFGAVVLTAINCAVYLLTDTADWLPAPLMFLGPSLAAIIVYVWARRNPHLRMSFLGLFEFDAPYLPWVMMGFGLLLGNSPYNDLLGIIVGHLYYFLADVYPAQTGRQPLKTPYWLQRLCGETPQPPPRVAAVRPAAAAAAAPQQDARRDQPRRDDNERADNGNGVMHEHEE